MKELLGKWYNQSQQIAPVRIKGLDRKRLMIHIGEHGFTKGAEIGVDRGRFSQYMFKMIPDLHLTCVDPWYWRHRGESRYKSTKTRLDKFNSTILRKTGMDALADVPEESLDFVYIDGDHTFDYVMSDLIWWARKVRIGGIVALHDYYRFRGAGVIPAVDIYTQQHGITQWFLTDERTPTAFWIRSADPFKLDQK